MTSRCSSNWTWVSACFLACRLWLGAGESAANREQGDWPQLLGPTRDGIYHGRPLARSWPAAGPRVLWQREVGSGWATPATLGGKTILFHRLADQMVVECLDTRSGRALWKKDYPSQYRDDFGFEDGPRATPAMTGEAVFTHGPEGRLCAWKREDGSLMWSVDTAREFGSAKGFFGRACSPLVEGETVILQVGGRAGAGIVGFAAKTGKVVWRATDDEAGYSSPRPMDWRGRRVVLSLNREALVALQPADGKVLFRFGWRPPEHASVSAAVPVVVGDQVFLSACYGAGATVLLLEEGGPKKIWARDDALSCHYATSVYRDGHLYGWHGRQEQGCELRCVDWKTGDTRWSEAGLKAGSVLLAGKELLVLTEQGELLRVAASPERFQVLERAQILPFQVRALPALADGLFLARSRQRLVVLDLASEP